MAPFGVDFGAFLHEVRCGKFATGGEVQNDKFLVCVEGREYIHSGIAARDNGDSAVRRGIEFSILPYRDYFCYAPVVRQQEPLLGPESSYL